MAASKSTTELLAAEKNTPHGYPFEWAGETFILRPQFDIRAMTTFRAGDWERTLRFLVGPDEAQRMLEHDTDEVLGLDTLAEMMQTSMQHLGMTMGESPASQS